MKKFNVLANCVADKHYMVDISNKIAQIQAMVDEGLYFTINRARQYGKTTTLGQLKKALMPDYIVARMSFEGIGSIGFETPVKFVHMFMRKIKTALKDNNWFDDSVVNFEDLSAHITKMCQNKKVVLMIDEVDKTSNNQMFLLLLGVLRDKFISRNESEDTTFHSVILVGVYDIKNIKIKLINEGLVTLGDNEGSHNSPWNIAASFKVDMSFSPSEIATMLRQYEDDHNTGMNITIISEEIYSYTGGYPFMVSRICQCIDEDLETKAWTVDGVQSAVKIMLNEKNTLFDDMRKNLENHEELREFIRSILIDGETKSYRIDNPVIDFGTMFGYFHNVCGKVAILNKLFELRMTNYFISKNESDFSVRRITGVLKEEIVTDGRFNMSLCIEKFAKHYYELFRNEDITFYERHGRLLFLTYLQPLINGRGFYHIEAQTRNTKRMDIVVDYGTDQFIIELKLWKGDSRHNEAYTQLLSYMSSKGASDGYLLTFDFRPEKNRERRAEWIAIDGRRIFDVVI